MFVCYSHEDAFFAEEMMKHLKGLEDFGINPWIDKQIVPSQNWRQRIEGALAEAQAAICLVSSDFISSRFIAEVELPTLLHAEAKRGLHVYPIYVNFVDGHVLDHRGLLEWQGVNGPSDPIARWEAPKRHQECWGVLCQHLRERTNP